MSDSFAGITVPKGEPDGLRSAASRLHGVSGALEGVSQRLRSSPGMLSSWSGPASVSYAGSCLTNGAAAGAGTQAIAAAAGALRRFATQLEEAQEDARQAIRDARDAKDRIEQAERDIAQAQEAAAAARQRYSDATFRATLEPAGGFAFGGSALAEQAQAQNDIWAAEEQEAAARRRLDDAREDLERAQRRGNAAEERARDAAMSAAGALDGAGGSAPAFATPGAPAGPVTANVGAEPLVGNLWAGVGYDSLIGGVQGYAWYRGHTHVSGYTTSRGTAVAPYMRRSPAWARWTKYSKWAGGTTIVFSGLGGAASQMYADQGRNLTSEQRVVRTTAGAANDAALSWSGAAGGAWVGSRAGGAAGAAIGSVVPVVGTGVGGAVGAAGGAIVGGIVGSGAGSWVADHTREAAADFAQGVGDGADDVWDSTAGARDKIGDGLDAINPF